MAVAAFFSTKGDSTAMKWGRVRSMTSASFRWMPRIRWSKSAPRWERMTPASTSSRREPHRLTTAKPQAREPGSTPRQMEVGTATA